MLLSGRNGEVYNIGNDLPWQVNTCWQIGYSPGIGLEGRKKDCVVNQDIG